jgi:hypothetical protein
VVDNPLAFTVPLSVAEVDVTFDAELVVTVGGKAAANGSVVVVVSVELVSMVGFDVPITVALEIVAILPEPPSPPLALKFVLVYRFIKI